MSQSSVGLPSVIFRSAISTTEIRALLGEALIRDIPVQVVDPASGLNLASGLALTPSDLRAGLPVGSVEFIRSVMGIGGVKEPAPMSYPWCLDSFLLRRLVEMPLERLRTTDAGVFIKPATTKLFNGFVWRPHLPDSALDAHDLEQVEVLRGLAPTTRVLACEVVKFQSEWRYYVLKHEVVGAARYDQDGDESAPQPDLAVVEGAIAAMREHYADGPRLECPAAYALDFGVLSDGRTALVEVNDAWALGLYGSAVTPAVYLQMLWRRWMQICGR